MAGLDGQYAGIGGEPVPVPLTVNNGKEFSNHESVVATLQINVYFADPYSAWQREHQWLDSPLCAKRKRYSSYHE